MLKAEIKTKHVAYLLLILAQLIATVVWNLHHLITIFIFLDSLIMFYLISSTSMARIIPFWIVFVLFISGFSIAPYGTLLKTLNGTVIFPISAVSIVLFMAAIILILALGFLLSMVVFHKLEALERLVVSYALGAGTIAGIMMLLGTLATLTILTVLVTYSGLLLLLLSITRERLREMMHNFNKCSVKLRGKTSWFTIGLIILTSPFIVFSIMHAVFIPDMYTDSLIYGNHLARLVYDNKQIPFIAGGPSIGIELSANYPPASQLLAVFTYMVSGEENQIFLKLLSAVNFLFLILLTYLWSTKLFKSKTLVLLAVLLLVLSPVFIVHSRAASFYIYLSLQFSLAAYFLQKFISTNNKAFIIASAVFSSFAALTSYLGLLIIPLALSIFFHSNTDKKRILLYIFIFILLIQPWYLRNFLLLGNPVWPFGGGNFIDPLIAQNTYSHLSEQSRHLGFNYESLEDLASSIKRMFFSYMNFFDSTVSTGLKPFLIMFALPAVFLWLKKRNEAFDIFVIWLIFILLIHASVFNMFERYLALALLPAIFLSLFLLQEIFKIRFVKISVIIFLALQFVNSLFASVVWNECIGATEEKVTAYMSSLGNYGKILETCYPDDANVWNWVNRNVKDNELVATTDFRLYYFNKTVINLDSWRLRDIYYANSIDESVEILKKSGVKYLAVGVKENLESPGLLLLREFGAKRIFKVN